MYLNPRVHGSIPTEGKNSTREGGGEGREVKHRDRHDGARGLLQKKAAPGSPRWGPEAVTISTFNLALPYSNAANIFVADALCCMGAGYKVPTMHALRGNLLNKWVVDVKKQIEEYRSYWKDTGCTLLVDGWTDRCRRTLINFLVYCLKGTVFIKSVDASKHSKTANMLFKLFKEVVLYVGPENVVQFVTDNAANYVAARKLLENEFPKLYWSPCATHCINLMLQDMGKLEEVREAVSHPSKITKFIYNHCFALYLMRQHTGGREILRPAPTQFATNFIALQSILNQKDALRTMVTSKEWTTTHYSKDAKAKQFVEQVLDSKFWSECADIVKITEPLVRVLRIVDSEDKFSPEYENHETTTSGSLDVIEKYAYDCRDLRTKLTAEMRSFRNCEDSFGRKTAIEDRTEVLLDQWWEMYGTEAPNLKKLAIRILSQTCSASGCERNWSVNKKKQNYDPINFETLDDHFDWVLEDSPPFLTIEEVEALRNDLANMTIQPLSNDIDQLNLDEVEDDAQLGENVEQSNNIVDGGGGDDVDAFDVDVFDLGEPNIDTTMPPWN
ncbi:hypothetical protein TSUD_330520 [Trifolium subterraneum]|nr:hypothetical protein TSUD_330520 [Trifolium subterraneum]